MKLAVEIGYWSGWMGGRRFLINLVSALKQTNALEIVLFCKVNAGMPDCVTTDEMGSGLVDLKEICLGAGFEKLHLVSDMSRWSRDHAIDMFGPSYCPDATEITSVGYIPDFQHKYYPQYFSEEELSVRELGAVRTIRNADRLMVGDISVVEDIDRFYPWRDKEIFVLPRLDHFLIEEIRSNLIDVRDDEAQPYFLVCSQRWKHKRHDLVLDAFASFHNMFADLHPEAMLVFTGDSTDYRFANLNGEFKNAVDKYELSSKILDLGMITRAEQLRLIQNARALLTASEFEGGVGASGVLEAEILGVPVIAPLNRIFRDRKDWRLRCVDYSDSTEVAWVMKSCIDRAGVDTSSEEPLCNNKASVTNALLAPFTG